MIRSTWLRSAMIVMGCGVALMLMARPAAADCRSDLLAADSGLKASRAGVDSSANAAAAVKCAAYRKHVAALTKVRDVFTQCDTGKQRDANLAAVGATLNDFTARVRETCAPSQKKK